jgi:hypothetical protein
MDWTEKLEHKKKIRKMAYRMLWADFKDMVLGWKVFLLILMYLGFFLLPYVKKVEDFNAVSMYYFVTWVVMSLNALAETSFNYLPLSTKDIVSYLKIRANHQIAWMVLVSGVSAIVLDVCGQEVFWERGLIVLVFLLITVEWMFFMTLYGYSKPYGANFSDDSIPLSRKVRIVIYNVYSVCLLFGSMFVGMFMKYNENAKTKILVILCLYLIMYIFRADAVSWVRFNEFNKTPRRSMWGNAEALNQKQ